MGRLSYLGILALVGGSLLWSAGPATALTLPAPLTIPDRVVKADAIVMGNVVELEKELVKASPHPLAAEKVDFQIAVIRIGEGLSGAKGLTTIRVGFPAPMNNKPLEIPQPPNGPRILRPSGFVAPSLAKDQEGCFFLTKHADADFYVLLTNGRHLDKKDAAFARQLDLVKSALKVLDNPSAALKAAEAADRQFAACVLVQKYRNYPRLNDPTKVAQEPIDAEESKVILRSIAEMDWAPPEAKEPANGGKALPFGAQDGISPHVAFRLLGLTPKDGWTEPQQKPNQDFREVVKLRNEAALKWLKDNADKYRIQRYVVSGK